MSFINIANGLKYNGLFVDKRYNCIKSVLLMLGFDFSLIGSKYLLEILEELINYKEDIQHKKIQSFLIIERHNIKIKSLNRDLRWAISKAYTNGFLRTVPIFNKPTVPSTKSVIAWVYQYFLSTL